MAISKKRLIFPSALLTFFVIMLIVTDLQRHKPTSKHTPTGNEKERYKEVQSIPFSEFSAPPRALTYMRNNVFSPQPCSLVASYFPYPLPPFVTGKMFVGFGQQIQTISDKSVQLNLSNYMSTISALAVNEVGELVAADERGDIWWISAKALRGEKREVDEIFFQRIASSPGSIITSLAFSKDHVYAADAQSKQILKYSSRGNASQVPTVVYKNAVVPSAYFDVMYLPEGDLVLVDPGKQKIRIVKHGDGSRSAWGTGGDRADQFIGCCNPSHIAAFSNGDIVTLEKGIGRISRYTKEGRWIETCAVIKDARGTEFADMAVDGFDRIWIIDKKTKMIRIFALHGGE